MHIEEASNETIKSAKAKSKKKKTEQRKSCIKIKQTCEICEEKFLLQTEFVAHCKSKHGIEKAFKCEQCSARMRSSSHLRRHMRMHDEVPRFTCQDCGLGFNQKSNLELHIRRKHSKEVVVKCDICNKGFFCKAALEDHKNTHTGQRPFKCHLCDKSYMNKAHLALHKRWSHPELFGPDRYHKCQICSKTFPYKKRLIKHLESHAGVRKYLCDLCGKAISTLASLRHHRRTHTGEKPEVCNVCGRAFSTSKYLREHFRTHTGEKPYTCSYCGRGFTQRGSLSLHEKSHSGDDYLIKPALAERVLQSRQRSTELLQEMGLSVDTSVFPCHVCNKTFLSRSQLSFHINSNHSEK